MSSHEARTDPNQCQWRFLDVPVCLYLSQISQPMPLSNCVSNGTDVFPCHAMFHVSVRNCEDDSRILNDLHRITIMACFHSSRALAQGTGT
ncbi:hypothetical protein T05_6012 [Trichinella murrelli]|uniref:Uncharacterized protein n=1 Tax=Trichinella murrelli TaxID=144512 RepID=A0A0V0T7D2_9BILA|nr:hypothetical protein T05_6012 [Trichinella murrelli]